MQSLGKSTNPLCVGDLVEVTYGEPGIVKSIDGNVVRVEMESGLIVTKPAVEVEIAGIAHDLVLGAPAKNAFDRGEPNSSADHSPGNPAAQ